MAEHLAVGVEEIEVVEPIAFALVDELVFVPREEGERILRFYETVVSFGVESLEAFTSGGIISHEVATLLAAWHLHDVEGLAVRTPREVGEIAVGDVVQFQPNGAVCGRREDANSDFVHRHTCHGIFVGIGLSNAHFWVHQSVDLWIVCHHGLVHAIESELIALGAPECTFVDAKLIAVNRGAVEQFAVAICRHLMGATVGGGDKEVVVFDESEGTRGIAEVLMTDAPFER